ncbi:FAD-binding oxidoreductase [Bacillus sp. Marseille-P3661]|uniref:FAD-binding oxidoreductase n=1 Tax=Bacillus sp. Marseille-P3661 TaxID=1936234 RepID=UPI000C857BD4|nr:FAD-linked oxidase C-terminal domain-containing protein [Bacillus sp. Marseille-P3661]
MLKTEKLVEDLLTIIPDTKRVTTNETILEHHSKGITYHEPHLPDVVVFPENKEEVQQIVQYAHENEVPIVPFGVGSCMEGQVIPVNGGISIDFIQMNNIIEVRPDDFIVKVQPGVTRQQLNKHLKKYGLFFPVDPGADATIGGMAATNASGTNAVKYGIMRDNVLGLEVVLADGKVIKTGGTYFKSSAGYDLTGLMVGSEGTLGVFTEITLRLYGIPEVIMAAKANFPSIEAAGKAAESILKSGIPVSRMELVDEKTIEAVNEYKQTNYKIAPTLFFEFVGSQGAVNDDVELAKEVTAMEGCVSFEFETDSIARAQLWEARHDAAFAIVDRKKGKLLISTDVCVPISELTNAIVDTRRAVEKYGIYAAILGHVGDGNYHAACAVDPNDPDEMKRMKLMNEEIIEFALAHGGTCTGEHGIGVGKIQFLKQQHGYGVEVMKMIKSTLDPKGILNPGKIF